MHPQVKTLIELQQLDSTVSVLSSRIESAPQEAQALKDQLSEFIRICEERKARLVANQKVRRDLEGEGQSIGAKISRHKDQLYQVKTNEQYRAMLKEVEGEEENLRNTEDRILEKMVEAEQIEKQIREAASGVDAEKTRVAGEVGHLEMARQQAVQQREALIKRRGELVAGLTDEVVNHYERLLRGRNGVALAEVRDGLCTGCHVRLRPQAYNEIRAGDVFMTCEACSRILYYNAAAAASGDAADPESQSAAQV